MKIYRRQNMTNYDKWRPYTGISRFKRMLPWYMYFTRDGRIKDGADIYLPVRNRGRRKV